MSPLDWPSFRESADGFDVSAPLPIIQNPEAKEPERAEDPRERLLGAKENSDAFLEMLESANVRLLAMKYDLLPVGAEDRSFDDIKGRVSEKLHDFRSGRLSFGEAANAETIG